MKNDLSAPQVREIDLGMPARRITLVDDKMPVGTKRGSGVPRIVCRVGDRTNLGGRQIIAIELAGSAGRGLVRTPECDDVAIGADCGLPERTRCTHSSTA